MEKQKGQKKDTKKVVKKESKKETKKDIIRNIKKHKEEIQKLRFALSGGAQQKSGEYKKLRKAIARAATRLTELSKEKREQPKPC